jgi:phosphoribosylglycinamide formyltransferase 1
MENEQTSPPTPLLKERGDSKIDEKILVDISCEVNIAIFASGGGSNAKEIIEYFKTSSPSLLQKEKGDTDETSPPTPLQVERGDSKIDEKNLADKRNVNVSLIVCNKPNAGVLQIAKQYNIPSLLIEKESFYNSNTCLQKLQQHNIHFIALAGFLWKMPTSLTSSYQKKIINIHPALLPKYGGKGMYGHYVHEAVIAAKETQTGITIHYVDEIYDNGEIIFQATCPVSPTDTAQTLATKVHALEHLHYAPIIASVLPNHR